MKIAIEKVPVMKHGIAYLLMLFSFTLFAEVPALTIYYYDRMPYYGDIEGKAAGSLVDITRQIAEAAGIPCRFVKVPPKRVLELLKEQKNACAIGWFRNRERTALYTFSRDPIYQDAPFRVVVAADKQDLLPAPRTIQSILNSGLELGVIDGFIYGDWLDDNLMRFKPKIQKVDIGDDSEKLYKMIIAKRFDYLFAGTEEGSYIVNKTPLYQQQLALLSIADAPMGNPRYILFNKGVDPLLLDKVNAAIPRVKASAKYKRVVNQIQAIK